MKSWRLFQYVMLVVLMVGMAQRGECSLFTSPQTITGSRASGLASFDVDKDGALDVVMSSYGEDRVAWAKGDGLGGFGPMNTIGVVSEASQVGAGDLDGDLDGDVVGAGFNDVFVFLNLDGTGTSWSRTQIGDCNSESQLVVADTDKDGGPEILIACELNGVVTHFANSGSGTFPSSSNLPTVANTNGGMSAVAVMDLNGDTWPDVVYGSSTDDSIGWVPNDGTGSFVTPFAILTSGADQVFSILPSDLNGDGLMDITFACTQPGNQVAWIENLDGAGSFSGRRVIVSIANPSAFTVADFSGDEVPDIVYSAGSGVHTFFKPGSLVGASVSFGPSEEIMDRQAHISVADDWNKDGALDLVTYVIESGAQGVKIQTNIGFLASQYASPLSVGNVTSVASCILFHDDPDTPTTFGLAFASLNESSPGIQEHLLGISWGQQGSNSAFAQTHILASGDMAAAIPGSLSCRDVLGDGHAHLLWSVQATGQILTIPATPSTPATMTPRVLTTTSTPLTSLVSARLGRLSSPSAPVVVFTSDHRIWFAPLPSDPSSFSVPAAVPTLLFADPDGSTHNAGDIHVADVNADSANDALWTTTASSPGSPLGASNGIYLLLGSSTSSMNVMTSTPISIVSSLGSPIGSLTLGSLDSSPGLDVAWALLSHPGSWFWSSNNVTTLTSSLMWSTSPPTEESVLGGRQVVSLVSHDFSGDAVDDMVVVGCDPSGGANSICPVWRVAKAPNSAPDVVEQLVLLDSAPSTPILVAPLSGRGSSDLACGSSAGGITGARSFVTPSGSITRRVPVERCGFRLECVARTLYQLSPSAVAVQTLTFPPGAYTACFTSGPVVVSDLVGVQFAHDESLTESSPVGPVTFDCGSHGGGVLFSFSQLSSTVSFVSESETPSWVVVGADATKLSSIGSSGSLLPVSPLSFSSIPSVTLAGLSIADSVSTTSGGALSFLDISSALVLLNSTLSGNSALLDGGGLALINVVQTTLVNCTVRGNTGGRRGGGISVDASGLVSTSFLAVNRSFIDGNVATAAGGGFYLEGYIRAVAVESAIVANSARWGGGIAATLEVTFPPSMISPDLVPLSSGTVSVSQQGVLGDGSGFVLSASSSLWGNQGRYGGGVMVCEFPIVLSDLVVGPSPNEALLGGGFAFVCNTAGAMSIEGGGVQELDSDAPSLPWITATDPGSLSVVATLGSAAFGPIASTPPVAFVQVSTPPGELRVSAGMPLTGVPFALRDLFGHQMYDEAMLLTVSLEGAANFELVGQLREQVLPPGVVTFSAGIAVMETSRSSEISVFGNVSVVASLEASSLGPTTSLTVAVTTCAAGQGRVGTESTQPFQCQLCPELTYNADDGTRVPCSPCPTGSEALGTGAVACNFCIEHATKVVLANATGVACQCEPGYWSADPSSNFAPCLECLRPDACLAGSVCAPGHVPTGYMCRTCDANYYSDSSGRCVACPPASGAILGSFVVLLILSAVLAFGALFLARQSSLSKAPHGSHEEEQSMDQGEERERDESDRFKKPLLHTMSAGLLFFQILSLLSDAPLSWPESTRQALQVFRVANVDISLFASECSVSSFYAKYSLSVLYPLVIVGVVLSLVPLQRIVLTSCHRSHVTVRQAFTGLLLLLGPLLYIPLSKATLVFFDCTRLPDSKWYLDVDLGLECFTEEWLSVLPVAILGLFVWVIGIPGTCAFLLYRVRDQLDRPEVVARYGGLYRHFRVRYAFVSILVLLKSLSAVTITLFFSRVQIVQLSMLLLVFASWAVFTSRFRPFFEPLYNVLEIQLTGCMIAIITLGNAFYIDAFPNAGVRTLFVVFTFVVIATAIGCLMVSAFREFQAYRWRSSHAGISRRESILRADLAVEAADWDRGSLERVWHRVVGSGLSSTSSASASSSAASDYTLVTLASTSSSFSSSGRDGDALVQE